MAKLIVYCSNCGLQLLITRKALPKYNTIIELIDPHECLEEPVEFKPRLNPVPTYKPSQPKGKFAKQLEDMSPSRPFPLLEEDAEGPGDRRPTDQIKGDITTTAPRGILDHVKTAVPEEPGKEEQLEPKE